MMGCVILAGVDGTERLRADGYDILVLGPRTPDAIAFPANARPSFPSLANAIGRPGGIPTRGSFLIQKPATP